MNVRQLTATLGVALVFHATSFAYLGTEKAQYLGGSWTVNMGNKGYLQLQEQQYAVFVSDNRMYGANRIPYDRITSITYGQKAGRRVGATIAWGVTVLGPLAIPILFSKKRKHFMTVNWTDEQGKPQGAAFQLGKNATRPTLRLFEARSGKKIDFESPDAQANIGN